MARLSMVAVSARTVRRCTALGAEYGGSIPAILIKTPGANAAAATVLDGYAMNRQGRGGEALGISLYSGVIGGFVGLLMLVMLTRPLASLALAFTPMSYFALGVLGLSVVSSLAGRNCWMALRRSWSWWGSLPSASCFARPMNPRGGSREPLGRKELRRKCAANLAYAGADPESSDAIAEFAERLAATAAVEVPR